MTERIYRRTAPFAVGFACAVALTVSARPAFAQAQQPQAQQPQQPGAQAQGGEQPGDEPDIDEKRSEIADGDVVVEPHMQPDERPQPPQSEAFEELRGQPTTVATGAGVGSDIAYASRGVVELGGTLSLTHQSQTTIFRLAPSIGYFIVDNIELTLFPELSIINIDDDTSDSETDVSIGGLLEPSYHMPFTDRLLGFIGLGLGVRYADDPGVDVFLRPRIGVDVLVGRSGIFKPAAFVDIGANDGLTSGGFEASFTVML